MLDAFNALVPIFLVIACGILIRRIHYIPDNVWPAIDQLCWYVLFPILIIKTLALADLDSVPVQGLATALAVSAVAIIALLFAIKPLLYRYLGISGPGFTSFFQGTSRWNGFAALAIIQALYGEDGLVLGALGFAVLVPILQTTNVIVLTIYGEPESGSNPEFSMRSLLRQLVRNPMLVSIVIGIGLNFLDPDPEGLLRITGDLISSSALGLALLAVGAGLQFSELNRMKAVLVLCSLLKLIVMPLIIVAACLALNVTGLSREVAVVCGAAPTAGTAYLMARQMGGDADMAAAIVTFQTLLAVFTLPLVLYFLG